MGQFSNDGSIMIVMFSESDVKKKEFIPVCMEKSIQKAVFICIAPQRNEGIVILIARVLISMI